MKKKLIILVILLILVLGVGFFLNRSVSPPSSSSPSPSPSSSPAIFLSPTPTAESPAPAALPESYLIKNFSFVSQAPFGEWDTLHDEACEEAALALVEYHGGNQTIDAATMEDQIQKMVAWEIANFGSHKDLTVSKVKKMAEGFYGMENIKIENDITIDDIKTEISQNHPVIVPTAGRLLGNPYFRSPGPIYHMVVAIGYDDNNIIVQDVGTRRGDHYEYNEKIFFNAIHDWNGSPENIESGAKNILVF